jgi:mitogen-activated protein kinase kinase 5
MITDDDEDNDCITVRSDEELEALLTYCHWHQQYYRATSSPICIYPKYSKRRNALNLEVNTRPTAPSLSNPSSGDSRLSGGSSHRRPDEQALINLLSGGQITPNDLHYLEILGHGSGGTVYRTFHTPSKVIMAVKVLPLDATPDEQRQIISELEILHKCDSKYIIGFYGAFFQENKISICTEYMDGGSLDHFGAIPEVVLGKIAVGAVKGLSYLWSMKIMHRDIKPSNTLVNTQGHVKLCDFGVSVQLLTSLTQTFIGTNAYMAPERILGGEYGIHSEIWSLGVTLLEMALGRFPYLPDGAKPNTSLLPFDLLQCIVNEKPPSLPPDRFSPQLIDLTTQWYVCHHLVCLCLLFCLFVCVC